MIAYAAELGISKGDFTSCLSNNEFTEKINKQMSDGQTAGVSGTPGNIIYDMKSKTGIIVSGAQPLDNFKKAIDAMLKDPKSAAATAGATAAGPVVPVDVNVDHVRGSKTAQIALIEYSDYQCPFCHRVHPTLTQLLKDYDGKIMWVYRHFPLSFHLEVMPLALGAECVNKLKGADAYWKFSDKVMAE
jgi:protein-disulfide isomerase